MNKFAKLAAATAIALSAGTVSAMADSCSGHSHDNATAAGAVGGGLIGGLATHSVAGGLVGAVGGGLIGNAISRNQDCNHHARRVSYIGRDGHRHYAYR